MAQRSKQLAKVNSKLILSKAVKFQIKFEQMLRQKKIIERRRLEIQLKLQEKKGKESNESLKKFQDDKPKIDLRRRRFGFFHSKHQSRRQNDSKRGELHRKEEKLPSAMPINRFSNDGSFLDQFRKLTGIKVFKGEPHRKEEKLPSAMPINRFSNDGSFLDQFRKLTGIKVLMKTHKLDSQTTIEENEVLSENVEDFTYGDIPGKDVPKKESRRSSPTRDRSRSPSEISKQQAMMSPQHPMEILIQSQYPFIMNYDQTFNPEEVNLESSILPSSIPPPIIPHSIPTPLPLISYYIPLPREPQPTISTKQSEDTEVVSSVTSESPFEEEEIKEPTIWDVEESFKSDLQDSGMSDLSMISITSRTEPGVIQYAVNGYRKSNLTDNERKVIEDHYKYEALKQERLPDLSEYKEYKRREDKIGFQMLQKLGSTEGRGLGSDGSGILDPVNMATVPTDKQGLGVERPDSVSQRDGGYVAYRRKKVKFSFKFKPKPMI